MKLIVTGILLIAFIAIEAVELNGQSASRIKFKRGAVSAKVTGTLAGFRGKRLYTIRVRAGQELKVEQIDPYSQSHRLTIHIFDPLGEVAGDFEASCNNHRYIAPTVSGDYRIEVVECQKADPWRGRFYFKVTVR